MNPPNPQAWPELESPSQMDGIAFEKEQQLLWEVAEFTAAAGRDMRYGDDYASCCMSAAAAPKGLL